MVLTKNLYTGAIPIRQALIVGSLLVACLWAVELIQIFLSVRFSELGVYPRELSGLPGILTAPLIHGSLAHLVSNTLPMLVLASALWYGYPVSRWRVLAIVWLVSGAGVWLWGRPSYHFGASGVVHGLFYFLLVSGLLRKDKRSIALLMIAAFMHGTLLWTILPYDPRVSFEAHFFGAVGGVLAAFWYRNRDPLPAKKVYSWEHAADEDEEDLIGDQWKLPADEASSEWPSERDP